LAPSPNNNFLLTLDYNTRGRLWETATGPLCGVANSLILNDAAWYCIRFPGQMKQPERALGLAQKSVALAPGYINLNTLGVAYLRVGEYRKAVETFEAGITVNNGQGGPLDFLPMAISSQRPSDAARARKPYEKGIQIIELQASAIGARDQEETPRFRKEAEEELGIGGRWRREGRAAELPGLPAQES
jgi:tetratricopeptide (TPR) repeat protein